VNALIEKPTNNITQYNYTMFAQHPRERYFVMMNLSSSTSFDEAYCLRHKSTSSLHLPLPIVLINALDLNYCEVE